MVEITGTVTQDDFIDALDRGDAKAAATFARVLGQLDGSAAEAIADMLDGDRCVRLIHPFRIKLVRWRRGNPSNKLLTRAKSTTRALMIERSRVESTKLEAAVAQVRGQTGRSRSTLMNDRARLRRKTKSPAKS